MQYWLNKNSNSKNVVSIQDNTLLVATVKQDDIVQLEQELQQNKFTDSLLSDKIAIAFDKITKIKSLSTETDIDFSYRDNKDEDYLNLEFETAELKQEFINALQAQKPESLNTSRDQSTPLRAASLSLLSLAIALCAMFVYANKLGIISNIAFGLWAVAAAFCAHNRFNNPPEITLWSIEVSSATKTAEIFKLGRAWAIAMTILFYGAHVLPDRNGPQIIYDHAAKEMLSVSSIEKLIQRGGDINYAGDNGMTALHLLVDQADTRAIEIGENMIIHTLRKATTGKGNLTKEKLKNEPEEIALALIQHGADVNAKDKYGTSVLELALGMYSHNALTLRLFESLLENGASTDFTLDTMTPFEYAQEYPAMTLDQKNLASLLDEHSGNIISQLD